MVGRKKDRSLANVIQSSDDGEAFDLNVSDSSVGNDPVAPARHGARSGTSRHHAAPAAAVSKPTVAPIAPTPPVPTVLVNADAAKQLAPIPQTGSNRSSQAHDTNYFYFKHQIDVKGDLTVRNVCRLCW
jgi:hypothetical protein